MPQELLVIEDSAGPKAGQRILRLKGPVLINNLFDVSGQSPGDISRTLVIDFSEFPYMDSAASVRW